MNVNEFIMIVHGFLISLNLESFLDIEKFLNSKKSKDGLNTLYNMCINQDPSIRMK